MPESDSRNNSEESSTDDGNDTMRDEAGQDVEGNQDRGGGEGGVGREDGAVEKSTAIIAGGKKGRFAWPSWFNGKRRESPRGKRRKTAKGNKRKRKKQQTGARPHGEGYVEFLDGWGVSQVGAHCRGVPRKTRRLAELVYSSPLGHFRLMLA